MVTVWIVIDAVDTTAFSNVTVFDATDDMQSCRPRAMGSTATAIDCIGGGGGITTISIVVDGGRRRLCLPGRRRPRGMRSTVRMVAVGKAVVLTGG